MFVSLICRFASDNDTAEEQGIEQALDSDNEREEDLNYCGDKDTYWMAGMPQENESLPEEMEVEPMQENNEVNIHPSSKLSLFSMGNNLIHACAFLKKVCEI